METFVVRLWLPDRPGALGAVASRIGAVRGDVIGIDILETGGGQAVDELVVRLPQEQLLDLLVDEIEQVDGVQVEFVHPIAESVHDPRLDGLETAAVLVGAETPEELLGALCTSGSRALGAQWAAIIETGHADLQCGSGLTPDAAWLHAFVAGRRAALSADSESPNGLSDVTWAPLVMAGLDVVMGRDGTPFRARERRQVAAMARIVDTRFRELTIHSRVSNQG